MEAAAAEFVAAKIAAKRSPLYTDSLRNYLRIFVAHFGDREIHSFTHLDIAAWFAAHKETPQAILANLGRLSSFFTFCRRRGWCVVNPTTDVERPSFDRLPPAILTPDQCRKIMAACEPKFHAYLATCLFLGVRPSEAKRLLRSDYDVARKLLTVRLSKVRRWRHVPIPDNALAWMLPTLNSLAPDAPVCPLSYVLDWRKRLGERAGVPLLHDQLRHTAASYWLAKHNDAGKVAHWLGNSVAVLLRHYYNLVSPEDSAAFFALTPPTVEPEAPAYR